MKKLFVLFVLIILAPFLQKAFAQKVVDKAKPTDPVTFILTEAEQKQAGNLAQQFIDARAAYQKSVAEAQTVELSDCAKVTAAVAKQQITAEKLEHTDQTLATYEQQLAKDHGCDGCRLSKDLRSLVVPQAAANK